MKSRPEIFEAFKEAFNNDKSKFIKPWMSSWDYQDIRKKRQVDYSEGLPTDFYTYNGPADIVEWFKWQDVIKPDYFNKNQVEKLINKSKGFDKRLFDRHDLDFNLNFYEQHVARNNAQDFILSNFYPMLHARKGQRILDFGAGYGRQFNLWSQSDDENLVFVSMDAIPKSYCLQNLYYNNSDYKIHEYVYEKDSFSLDDPQKGVYHLPTWRFDLIPDNFFDKILVVQVLQELNGHLVKHVINEFQRVLKPEGVLYIRDHMNSWRPTHKLNIDKYLSRNGFILEFKPHIIDKVDLHGIPRIYRKINPEVIDKQKVSTKQRLIELKNSIDSATGGKLKNIIKRILRKE